MDVDLNWNALSYGVSTFVAALALWIVVKAFPATASRKALTSEELDLVRRSNRVTVLAAVFVSPIAFLDRAVPALSDANREVAGLWFSMFWLVPIAASMVVVRKHGIDALGFFARVAEQQHGMNGRAFVLMMLLISLGAFLLFLWAITSLGYLLYTAQTAPIKVMS